MKNELVIKKLKFLDDKNKEKIIMEIIPTLIIIIFGLAHLGRMFFLRGSFLRLASWGLFAIMGVIGNLYVILVKPNKEHLYISLILITLMTMSSIHTGNYQFIYYIVPFLHLGIGVTLINFRLNIKISYLNFIFYFVFFLYFIFKSSDAMVFHSSSRNYNSIVMIYNAILLYIALKYDERELSILPALGVFLISIISIGRSGIIVSALFFLGVLFTSIIKKSKLLSRNLKVLLWVGLIIIAILFIVSPIFDFMNDRYFKYLFAKGLSDPARLRILKEYMDRCSQSIGNFLFGVPLNGNKVFLRYGYNLHNSFLRLHSLFGFFGVLLFGTYSLRALFYYLKYNRLYFLLLMVILLRITTDTAAFFGMFDTLLFYFLSRTTTNNGEGKIFKKSKTIKGFLQKEMPE